MNLRLKSLYLRAAEGFAPLSFVSIKRHVEGNKELVANLVLIVLAGGGPIAVLKMLAECVDEAFNPLLVRLAGGRVKVVNLSDQRLISSPLLSCQRFSCTSVLTSAPPRSIPL